jgi:pimeloyl-ACP methyl ester carboxylesterase
MPSAPRGGTIETNGLSLHYLDWGGEAQVPAIALHGFALNCHSWDEVAPALLRRVRLLAFDQRGHGLSDRAARLADYSRDAMVSDIEGIVRSLELDRPVILGHSMGGMNAMSFAGRHPDRVRALVLVDVGPEIRVDGANEVLQFVRGPYELESLDAGVAHTHRYYPYRSKEGIRRRLEVSLVETERGTLRKQYDERFRDNFGGVEPSQDDIWEAARAIRCPTLLVHGGASPVLSLEMAHRFADEVEKVRFTSIPGAGHSVAGDKPAEFSRVVLEFLNQVLS